MPAIDCAHQAFATSRSLRRQALVGALGAVVLLIAGVAGVHWRHARLVAIAEQLCRADAGSVSRQQAGLERLRAVEAVDAQLVNAMAAAGLLVLLAGAGWALVYVLQRVETISAALARANSGESGVRIVSARHDELGALAEQCNALLARRERGSGWPAQQRTTAHAEAAERPATAPRHRVLVVEDAPETRRATAIGLRKAGMAVELAEDGVEAFEKARAAPFDLILMDMELPVLSGYDAVRRLRLEGYAGRIVGLSSGPARQRCLDAGCDEQYTKPLDQKTLLGLLLPAGKPVAGAARPR